MATIVIVDDEKPSRTTLGWCLRHDGHTTHEAGDAIEGMRLARTLHPDLIISDVLMPETDGFEFVRQLRADSALAAIPVILWSSIYQDEAARELARSCGVAHFLTKPVELDSVRRAVHEALAEALRTREASRHAAYRQAFGDQRAPYAFYDKIPTATSTSTSPSEFDREHFQLVNDALVQKVRELEQTTRRLTALVTLYQQLAAARNPSQVIATSCQVARSCLDAAYALIALVDDSGGLAEPVTSETVPGTARAIGTSLSELLTSTLRDGQAHRFFDASSASGSRSALAVPLIGVERRIGILCVGEKSGGAEFSAEDEQIACSLAAALATGHEQARAREGL